MRARLRRALYALGFLLWLIVMCLPLFAFVLAVRGEVNWQRGEYAGDRVWLIQEKDSTGVGWASTGIVSDRRAVDGPVCTRTTVRFLMWKGTAEGVEYCECVDAATGETVAGCGG